VTHATAHRRLVEEIFASPTGESDFDSAAHAVQRRDVACITAILVVGDVSNV
jgi:hypothetical protein